MRVAVGKYSHIGVERRAMTKSIRPPHSINVAALACLGTLTACAAPPSNGPSTAASPAVAPASRSLVPVIATVTVSCMIELDGYPSHCRVLQNTGDYHYVIKTLAWLNGPKKPRYKPAAKEAPPRREEHQWTISFSSQGAAAVQNAAHSEH
jgi:hypothetical protein